MCPLKKKSACHFLQFAASINMWPAFSCSCFFLAAEAIFSILLYIEWDFNIFCFVFNGFVPTVFSCLSTCLAFARHVPSCELRMNLLIINSISLCIHMTMRYRFDVYSSQLSPTFHPCGNSRSAAAVIRCVFYLRREGSLKSCAGLNKTDDNFSIFHIKILFTRRRDFL